MPLQYTMTEWLTVFHQTPGGAFAPNNVPTYLAPITQQTLLDSRAQGQPSFNGYRQAFGLPVLTRYAAACRYSHGAATACQPACISVADGNQV